MQYGEGEYRNMTWLTGWKAISNHLGVCERTAMRYTDNYGLPVRKFPSGKVTALQEEVKKWSDNYNKKLKKETARHKMS
jgi:hypothetical protein